MIRFVVFLVAAAVIWGGVIPGVEAAGIQSDLVNTLKLEAVPRDMALSADGQLIFILTGNNRVQVFGSDGQQKGTVDVAPTIAGIAVSPAGDFLFLQDREKNSIQVVSVNFIVQISVEGSPSKGPATAPIVVAVFNDFQ